jgi:hypothetical protein
MIHFTYGSSTAARTDVCQQWQSQSEGVPRKDSEFAQDGTTVHDMLERKALGLEDAFDHPRADLVQLAKDMWAETERVITKHKATQWEPEVTASTAPDVGGTLDLVLDCNEYAMFLDYKSGAGVQVSPENNKQILFAAANTLYGESTANDLVEHHTDFVGVIMQPNRAGEIESREWKFTRADVDAFWKQHQANIELARQGKGTLVAGDHCRFCPANGLCDATTGNLLRMQQLNPEDIEQLTWGLGMIEEVKQTIKAIEKKAYDALEIGQDIPGWKLVRGRPGNTSWDDEKAALAKLKRMTRGCKIDDVRVATLLEKKTIVSPTQAKALLKQVNCATHFLDEITHRPEPKGLTLAPASDKREAVLSADALHAALNSIR